MGKTINGLQVAGITDDSRKVKKDYLFIAVRGIKQDGHSYIDEAIKKGAKAIMGEEDAKSLKIPSNVTYRQIADSKSALGEMAALWFGNPSQKLKVIGVTGTDGKTTTASLIYHILKNSGKKVGLISTVSAVIGDRQYDTGFHVTNPDAIALQGFLAKMVKEGCEYAVLEVTSHGIAQKRIAGIKFDIAVLTNITHEHLDYHKSFSEYKKTKLSFVVAAREKVLSPQKTSIDIFEAEFNNLNAQTAVNVVKLLGIDEKRAISSLQSFKLPKGRLEKIEIGRDFEVYIDFAHTPNALENVLSHLKSKTKGRLIAVFGAAGERDASKRPLMGRAASEFADVVILTAEDPRSEAVEEINRQIKSGMNKADKVFSVPDRQEAINFAFQSARKGDTIGVFGKGHESSMNLDGKTEIPWSDHKAVQKALKYLITK